MIILAKYRIIARDNVFHVVSQEPSICPSCGGPMKVRDSKRRQIIMEDGSIRVFLLRRMKCEHCSSIHLELPDLIVPHKHYSREVIEMALAGSKTHCPAENSTIYRWSREHSKTLKKR